MGGKRTLGSLSAPSPHNEHRVKKCSSRDAGEGRNQKEEEHGFDDHRFHCKANDQCRHPTDQEGHCRDEERDAKAAPYECSSRVQTHLGQLPDCHPTRSPGDQVPREEPCNYLNCEGVSEQPIYRVTLHGQKHRAARNEQSRRDNDRRHKSVWSRRVHGDNIPLAATVCNGSKTDASLESVLGGKLTLTRQRPDSPS